MAKTKHLPIPIIFYYFWYSICDLESIYFKGGQPEKISDASIPETCKIYVPAEYLLDYKNALGSLYKYIYSWDPNSSETVNINQAKTRGIVASAHYRLISILIIDYRFYVS